MPDAVDSANNRQLQSLIEQMDGEFEIENSDNLYVGLDENDNTDVDYGDISSFQTYAAKGFISIDRTCTEGQDEDDRPTYHRVAYPRNGKTVTARNILALMPELTEDDIIIE